MKHRVFLRLGALVLCLVLALSLFGGITAYADDEIWTEEPTHWINWGHVTYKTASVNNKTYVLNWGVRGELCRFRSAYALDFYPDLYDGQGVGWGYDIPGLYEGGSSEADATDSELYAYLHSFLAGKQTHKTSYAETRNLYRYTDCMVSNSDCISSFYSGIKLNGAWDGGSTWNREHTWPKSKSTGDQENDIMMLRPTSVSENSGRGNLAYGESAGFYNPNAEAGNTGFDLRGDCARICLYCYVRWSENAGSMWGAEGVMESLDVLLDWMEQDPVDTWEMGRNDAVESITGVRNCFVDYPELAWYLFGRNVPEDYPTPFKEDHDNFVSAPACLEARSNNEAWGTVQLKGWAVDCFPAAGYYASGFELWTINGEESLGENGTEYFRWENGRLLYFPVTEADYLAEIHFTPVGQEDPCPTGHAWDEGRVTVLPTVTEPGERVRTCNRCGKTCTVAEYNPFCDLVEGKYYCDMVLWAYYHEPQITAGTDATHFSPTKECTRCQVVTFLWRTKGCPEPTLTENPFTDVKTSAYYYKAVLWAVENGITTGATSTTFAPNKVCTRAQVVTFLWRSKGSPEPTSTDCPFTDVKASSPYYKAILWAVEQGVTTGTSSTTFSPGNTCTRAQVVTFLYRVYGPKG